MLKYLPLVWAALERRTLRTILTLLSVTVAFTLFGTMMGTDAAFRRAEDVINRRVVLVGARFGDNLTDGMGQQIAAMPNVAAVSAGGNVFGYYRNPKTHAYAMMVDTPAGWPNVPLSKDQWAQWQAKRDGIFLSRLSPPPGTQLQGDRGPSGCSPPLSKVRDHSIVSSLVHLSNAATLGQIAGENHQQLIAERLLQRGQFRKVIAQQARGRRGLTQNEPCLGRLVEMKHALYGVHLAFNLRLDSFQPLGVGDVDT